MTNLFYEDPVPLWRTPVIWFVAGLWPMWLGVGFSFNVKIPDVVSICMVLIGGCIQYVMFMPSVIQFRRKPPVIYFTFYPIVMKIMLAFWAMTSTFYFVYVEDTSMKLVEYWAWVMMLSSFGFTFITMDALLICMKQPTKK